MEPPLMPSPGRYQSHSYLPSPIAVHGTGAGAACAAAGTSAASRQAAASRVFRCTGSLRSIAPRGGDGAIMSVAPAVRAGGRRTVPGRARARDGDRPAADPLQAEQPRDRRPALVLG